MAEAPGKHSLIVSGTVAGPPNEEYMASTQVGSGGLPNEVFFLTLLAPLDLDNKEICAKNG